jgi:hypothetical protein
VADSNSISVSEQTSLIVYGADILIVRYTIGAVGQSHYDNENNCCLCP